MKYELSAKSMRNTYCALFLALMIKALAGFIPDFIVETIGSKILIFVKCGLKEYSRSKSGSLYDKTVSVLTWKFEVSWGFIKQKYTEITCRASQSFTNS